MRWFDWPKRLLASAQEIGLLPLFFLWSRESSRLYGCPCMWNLVSCHLQIRTHLRNLVLFFYSCLNFSKLKMIMSCLEGRKQINKIKIKQLMEAKQIVGSEIMCLQLVISMESTGFHVSTFCCLSSLHISSSLNSPLCFFIYCFPFLSFIE